MKLKLLIVALFCSVLGWGQTTIAIQDFETSPTTPTWSYTNTGGGVSTTNTGTPNNQRIRNGLRSFQINNATSTLTFNDINVSGYNSVSVIIRVSSISVTTGNGADAADFLRAFVKLDAGSFLTNTQANANIAVNGNSNARWGYNATGVNTNVGTNVVVAGTSGTNTGTIYSTLTINIPNGTSTVGLRLNVLNDDANEIWCIDDVEIIGTPASSNTITTDTGITGSPFCVSASTGASVSVPFTSVGTFNAGNVYTAQLSNAAGSFASPTNIGTVTSVLNSDVISATIPAGTTAGTGYIIRVVSDNPMVQGSNTAAFTVNLANNSITPIATQNISTGVNGATLTVTEQSTPTSRQWYYATVSGGPYTNLISGATGTTYVPNFATAGTYYVVCVSTFACGTITSNQVQINVVDAPVNDLCASATTLTVNAGSIPGNMTGSTFTAPFTKKDVWYTFTASCTGSHTITVAGFSGDIDVELFSGACPASTTTIASAATTAVPEILTANLTSGITYRVRVLAFNAAAEVSTFTIGVDSNNGLTLTNAGSPAAGNVLTNTTAVLFGFEVTPTACTTSYNLSNITITKTGTTTTADLSNVIIYYDADGNGIVNGGESAVSGAGIALANTMNFTLAGQTGLSGVRKYLLVANVSAGATPGRTFTATLTSGNVTATTSPSGAVTGTATGNLQTIIAPEVAFLVVSATTVEDGIEYFLQVVSSHTGSHTANIFVSGGSATNGSQYTFVPVTATFAASTTFTTTVTINDNFTCDGNTNAIFGLNANVNCQIGANNALQLTITDDEQVNSVIKSLRFETTDDWTFTTTGTGAANTTANKYFGTQSYRMDGAGSLTTSNISLTGLSDVTLSVAFASVGVDNGDDLFLDISYDNGATWTGSGSVKLMDGVSNAGLNMGNTSAATVATNPWVVNVPASETQIRVRLRAIGISTGEYYFVDDIVLRASQCIIPCVPTHTVTSIAPTSGPEGTEVTINGSGLTGTTVSFNGGGAVTVVSNNGSQMVVIVPAGATTGDILINDAQPCAIKVPFTVIDKTGMCGGLTDLIMTEIYDESSGDLGYIEIYNGTGATINLATYKIERFTDAADLIPNNFTFPAGLTIASGQVLVGKLGFDAGPVAGDFVYVDQSGINEKDIFNLYNGTTKIDVFVVPSTSAGYTYRRNLTTTGPNPVSNPSDWSSVAKSTVNLGLFPYVIVGGTPIVNTNPNDVGACGTSASFSVVATPAGAGVLAYQWYYNNGVTAGWSVVSGSSFAGVTTTGFSAPTLSLNGAIGSLSGYQFYCLVTQDATCSVASDAAQLKVQATTWNGTTWSNGTPDLTKLAIINGNYDTTSIDNFECCSLLVNAGFTLNIQADDYVLIQNDLTNNGTLNVFNNGSLIQVNDLGVNTGTITYQRTAMARNLDYVYWSSPVAAFNVNNLPNNYRYIWDTTIANTNGGQGNWVAASGNMIAGKGYIARASNGSATPIATTTSFVGVPNNGVVRMPILRGSYQDVVDYAGTNGITITRFSDNWNLVGNPYPSAINVDKFLDLNTNIEGAVRIWTHGTLPSTSINNPFYGSYQANYTPDDYITHNGVGTVSGPIGFNGFLAGGQGFMVNMLDGPAGGDDLLFDNSLRNKSYNNSQFYRTSGVSNIASVEKNRIWLDLINNSNNAAKRTLIGYVGNATNDKDRLYDAFTSVGTTMHLYSIIANDKMTIQGRQLPFDANDKVNLGYFVPASGNYSIGIAALDGLFASGQNIYLEDNLLGIIHDLRSNPYSFSANAGEVNNRFVLRYTNETLGNEDFDNDFNVLITSSDVISILATNETIQSVQIHNVLGQLLVNEKNISSESFEINTLQKNKAPLIIQVTLENGKKIAKKLIF